MNTMNFLLRLLAALLPALIPFGAHANPGDLYVTVNGPGVGNGSIRIYAPDGTGRIFASGLVRPRGLAFDGLGNLFVATIDPTGQGISQGHILKFAPDGTATVFASGLDAPEGLAFDGAGNLYAVSNDLPQGREPVINPTQGHLPGVVTKISPDGARRVLILDPSTYHQNFGVAIDEQNNNVFVADNLQLGIYQITDRSTTFIPVPSLSDGVIGLAFDGTGNLFGSSGFFGDIIRITPDGRQTLVASGLGELRGLAFDFDGNLFAASPNFGATGHNAIYKITPDGSVSFFATGLDRPQFLAVEP